MNDAEEQDRLAARGLDVTVPNVARIYDYILGGKDNFDADRAAAEQILAVIPGGSRPARCNRAFLGRVHARSLPAGPLELIASGRLDPAPCARSVSWHDAPGALAGPFTTLVLAR